MTTKLITMMKNRDLFLQRMLFFAFAGILFYSCNPNPQASVTEESISNVKVDTSKTGIINVGGTLFSIPSPIQTAMLIKESNTEYDASILNSTRNLANYTSREIKALNLGIYGADLGYATIFEDNESAVNYLNTVEKLANDLEIIGALDKNILRRFANNVGNQDSMLILTSNFYRAGDAYLKDNDREDIAALILAGGWIEAAYFSCMAANDGNDQARTRLGEQRIAIENLVNVLNKYSSQETVAQILGDLSSLKDIYAEIGYAYKYEKPETYPDQKLTFINSSTSINVPDSALKQITTIVNNLRTKTAG